MRKKLRRQIAAKLKELKLGVKLYTGSKFKFYRRFKTINLTNMLEQLRLSAPGTIVEDCDSFNHVVVGFRPGARFRDWNTVYAGNNGYHFTYPQLVFEDGRWSCGCTGSPAPAQTRDEIEKGYLDYLKADTDWQTAYRCEILFKRFTALEAGEHITDERGVLLAEFTGD